MSKSRRVIVYVTSDDITDLDPSDDTGLTTEAFERLTGALSDAGFGWEDIRRDY